MAKDGKMSLPSVDADQSGVSAIDRITNVGNAKPISDVEAAISQVEGYVPRRVEARLTRAQAVKLRDKLRILQDSGAQTADGRFVSNRAQAMQWIIENEVVV